MEHGHAHSVMFYGYFHVMAELSSRSLTTVKPLKSKIATENVY